MIYVDYSNEDREPIIKQYIDHVRHIPMRYKTGCWHDFINWLGCIWRERIDDTVKRNTLFVDFKGIQYRSFTEVKDMPISKKVAVLIDDKLSVYSLTHIGEYWLKVSRWDCEKCAVPIKYISGVMVCEKCGSTEEL